MAGQGSWVAVDGGFDLVRDGTRVGFVRQHDGGWAAFVEHGGLEVEVGVYDGEPRWAQRAVERKLWG